MSSTSNLDLDASLRGVLGEKFLYGAASASHQIEGGYDADGKGPNVWDDLLMDKENGQVACDSYHMWREDIKLLKQYGCNTYRFSISWARVNPLGGKDDPVNEAGIKYYSDLVDALLAEGITPCVTIYHWDHPSELETRYGGFLSEKIVEDFVAFSRVLFERLGDRVKHWITINEPFIVTMLHSLALKKDSWVPGKSNAILARTLILSHARTVELYRKDFKQTQQGVIGITLNCDWVEPIDDSSEAKQAAEGSLAYVMGLYADPIFSGKYSEYMQDQFGEYKLDFIDEEWAVIKGSSDFFGLNHYGTSYATGRPVQSGDSRALSFGPSERVYEKDGKLIGNRGENGHPHDVPWGFRKLLRHISERYLVPNDIPLWVTENGFAAEGEATWPREEAIKDTQRQTYYSGYLKEMAEAVKDDGIRVEGYMAWALLDNLEWIFGYGPRFGITIVDRDDGCKRYPKDSSAMLKKIFAHYMAAE